jgi:hypothetical protein
MLPGPRAVRPLTSGRSDPKQVLTTANVGMAEGHFAELEGQDIGYA